MIATTIISTIVAIFGGAGAINAARNYLAREEAIDMKLAYWEEVAVTK